MFRFQEHILIFILLCVLCKFDYVNEIPFDVSPSAMISFKGVKWKNRNYVLDFTQSDVKCHT